MNTEPKYMALRLSFAIALLVAATIGILYIIGFSHHILWITLPVFALVFCFTYVIIVYTLNHFIYKKIKLVYKNILDHKMKPDKELRHNISADMIGRMDKEVSEWAEEHKKQLKQFAERERFQREFLGNITHELKTPLFNIEGYLSTLAEGGLDDPEINKIYIIKALKSTGRLINLVNDLDSISRLESGIIELYIQKINLVEVAKDVLESLEIKAKKTNITIGFNKDYDHPIWVMADKKRIRQVLFNLVDNAINYGKTNGKVEIRFYDMESYIMTEVADDGSGISQKHLPRLFERFYRVDESRSRQSGGTGLGLSIAKHIMDAHEQHIHVRSTPGVGSTFSFTLSKPKPLY